MLWAGLYLIGAVSARGQALPTATGPGGFAIRIGGGISSYQSDYSKRTLGGYTIYGDIEQTRSLTIEVEARVLRRNQEVGTHETTILVGPRLGHRTRYGTPYGKLLVGEGWFHFPYDYAEGKYLVIAPGAGLDIPIRESRFTVRAVDFEYQSWPNFTFGGLHPYGLSAGVLFRIR